MRLILVPTSGELSLLKAFLPVDVSGSIRTELCGFGLIAAAARTASLVSQYRPTHVLLLGIAGTFESRLPIGTAHSFDRVACTGIGVGSGDEFASAGQMGWPHWTDPLQDQTIGDELRLVAGDRRSGGLLLSVCSASGTVEDERRRLNQHPNAAAEDMEGFAVALACRLAGVELEIMRGISNRVGDRNKSHWKMAEALEAVGRLAADRLSDNPNE